MEYVSRAPRAPLDGLIDDLYYLEGAPPYARLTLPPPAALAAVMAGADPYRRTNSRTQPGFGSSCIWRRM
jgi:hypothetical protein